jgi:hypothetical protein
LELFPFILSAGLLAIGHEIGRELGQALNQCVPGFGLREKYYGTPYTHDKDFIAVESEFPRQADRLAFSVFKKLCSRRIGCRTTATFDAKAAKLSSMLLL